MSNDQGAGRHGLSRTARADLRVMAVSDYIARGIDHGCGDCIGLELEHFIVRADTLALVPYFDDAPGGCPGVATVLERLATCYDEQVYEPQADGSRQLIGLSRQYAAITLEPGAQFEVSIGPVLEIRDLEIVYSAFRAELDPILQEFGYLLLTQGYHPTSLARDIPLLPKGRYHHMDRHFQATGQHGICMMRATASTQVSIDYSSEADAIMKFRVANLLSPLLAFVTDNSPVFEGQAIGLLAARAAARATASGVGAGAVPGAAGDATMGDVEVCAGAADGELAAASTSQPADGLTASGLALPWRMARTAIWDDVDPMRSMTAPGCFTPSFGFDSYAESILKAPAVFTLAVDESGRKRSVYQHQRTNDELYVTDDMDRATIELILSLLFFDVRFKTYIEIRAADSLPIGHALAFAALIKGLFYSDGFIAELDERLKDYGTADIAAAKRALAASGYQATIYGQTAAEWLDELLAVAAASLSGGQEKCSQPLSLQAVLQDTAGTDGESAYLRPLAELVQQRATLVELTE